MPRKPPSPCKFPGCPKATNRKSGYCLPHEEKVSSQKYAEDREKGIKRSYTTRERKASKMHLREYPLCDICQQDGRTVAAEIVHHRDLDHSNYDEENLQSLCKHCHEALHAPGRFNTMKVYSAPYSGKFGK